MQNKKAFFIGLALGLLIMTGAVFGLNEYNKRTRWNGQPQPDAKVTEIFSLLNSYSINSYESDELMENMYRGLLDGVGDPYTYYFDEESLALFSEQTEGVYAGIGMVVWTDTEDRIVTVLTVYPETPAERAGLQTGDKIMAVNGLDVTTSRLEEVTAMTKGKPGTKVTLTVSRPSDDYVFDVGIMRENISIPTVSHKMLDDEVGYIRIEGFERVTYGQFTEAYQDLTNRQMKGLIIDLRNNPGGLMETVTQIANTLLPRGVIVYTEDKAGAKNYYYSDDNHTEVPLVLLVNEGSASASEVLSGAVKDMNAGTLVGAKTFGKGIVQNLYKLSDGSAIKVTVAKYYTPNGICIQGEGIVPDYVVEVDKETAAKAGQLPYLEDAQLLKAMEVMKDKIN